MKNSRVLLTLFPLLYILIFFSCGDKKQSKKGSESRQAQSFTEVDGMVEQYIEEYGEGDSIVYDLIDIKTMDVIQYYKNYDETSDDVMYVDFDDKYLDYAIQIYSEALKKMGYRKPSLETIQIKSKEVLGYDVEADSNRILNKAHLVRYVEDKNTIEERMRQREIMRMYDDTTLGVFWNSFVYVRDGGFIVKRPTIDGIVHVENEKKVAFIWNARKIEETFHLNNYVFYNSASSFQWLLDNQPDYLKDLCILYHYDVVPEINKLVIDDVLEKMEGGDNIDLIRSAYMNVFSCHDGNGKLYIHKGLLSYLAKYKNTNVWLVDDLFTAYRNDIYDSFADSAEMFDDYTMDERMKVSAYTIFYSNEYEQFVLPNQFVQNMLHNKEFLDWLSCNNYFELEGFSSLIERLRMEADEMEHLEQ